MTQISKWVSTRWLTAAAIDGPKKKRGHGGSSPATVTLVDVTMSEDGNVMQKWGVYGNGQKAAVVSKTTGDGDTTVHMSGGKEDLDLGNGLTAQQAVSFINNGSHPKYYPKPGMTVELDEAFVSKAIDKFSE